MNKKHSFFWSLQNLLVLVGGKLSWRTKVKNFVEREKCSVLQFCLPVFKNVSD